MKKSSKKVPKNNGRPKKQPHFVRDKWIPVRASTDDCNRLRGMAARTGETLAEFVRRNLGLAKSGYGEE